MKRHRHQAGLSLVELMIAAALVGIGILGAIASFSLISRSVQSSKARSLATNLAQEKMQIIMQKSYYEILVTTAPAMDTRVSPNISYDPVYFTPETMLEGSITFVRETFIQAVIDNSGSIQVVPSNASADTGMRQISVSVLWQSGGTSGEYHVLTIQNIINNPDTVMYNALAKGTVRDSSGNPLNSALVDISENLSWSDSTDNTGAYLIHMSSGVYSLRATAQGYYSQRAPISVAPGGTVTTNFTLTKIATGTVQGTAWLNQHLVISQVVASTVVAGNDYEYVELYNPTTYSIYIGTNTATPAWPNPNTVAVLWDQTNVGQTRHVFYVTNSVPPRGYYLITNTGNANPATACGTMLVANTVYVPDGCWGRVPFPGHALNLGGAGGFSLGNINSYTGDLNFVTGSWPGSRVDSIAWSDIAAGNAAPSGAVETTGLPSATGIQIGEQFVRKTSTGSILAGAGNAYDANVNSTDFIDFPALTLSPHTSTYPVQMPLTGTPAVGAIASAGDTISASSTATLVGNPPYAQFIITGVSTGTWSVFLDSGSSSAEIDNVVVTTNTITSISNASTSPPWPAVGINSVILSTPGVTGLVNGYATDVFGNPITVGPTINIYIGGITKAVNSSGYFSVRINTGTYDIVANPSNTNSLYESQTRVGVSISPGDSTSSVNFFLSQGGAITGWVTRDGVNPLPGISLIAADGNGLVQDTEVSGSNGRFTLVNLTTGSYTVQPILDPKETASPASAVTAIVSAGTTYWSSSFTVVGAMGTIAGTVKSAGQPIQTGVLIVVSTSTVASSPPALSTATLTSSAYYSDSSHEDGTYSVDVRGSSTTTYNVYAFYQHLNGQTPQISSGTLTGVTVNAGLTTSGKNFSW